MVKAYAGKRSGARKKVAARGKKTRARVDKRKGLKSKKIRKLLTKVESKPIRKTSPKTLAKPKVATKATKAKPKPKLATKAKPKPKPATKATKAKPKPKPATKATKAKPKPKLAAKATKAKPKLKLATKAKPKPKPATKATKAKPKPKPATKAKSKAAAVKAKPKVVKAKPKPKPKKKRTSRGEMLSRFRELQRHQRTSNQTPAAVHERQIDSRENVGEQRYVRVERVLDLGNVEQTLYRARVASKKLSGRFKIWYALCSFSGFGEDHSLRGYGRMLDVSSLAGPTDQAELFQVEVYDNTGVWNTREGMLIALEGLLEHYGGMLRTIVWLHGILIKNFDRKRRDDR